MGKYPNACLEFFITASENNSFQQIHNFSNADASNTGPTSGGVVTLKTGRREVPGSNPGRACRPSRSEFPVVFSETRVNTG